MKKKTQNPEPKPEPKSGYLNILIENNRLEVKCDMPLIEIVGYLELIKSNIIEKFKNEQSTK